MAKLISIMGESGSGKSTAMRNLDPETTFYIDCDKKGLPWKNWKKQYSEESKNYIKTDVQSTILGFLQTINDKKTCKFKTIVIDTINAIMVADEMRRMNDKQYDKWMDLAFSIYSIIDYALTMRDDIVIIFIAHSQTEYNDNDVLFTRIKTSGKKLDKITLESKFNTVLLAKCVDNKYVLETNSNFSTSKTPMGSFEEQYIPNDVIQVIEALKEY